MSEADLRSRVPVDLAGATTPKSPPSRKLRLRLGTRDWTAPIPPPPGGRRGRQLQDYAAVFNAIEVNATFYKTPSPATFARWRDRTPNDFRFALALPELITRRLPGELAEAEFDAFLGSAGRLGSKLAILVLHLAAAPFDMAAERALMRLGARSPIQLVCECRNPSWDSSEADDFLAMCRMPRVGFVGRCATTDVGARGWPSIRYLRARGWSDRDGDAVLARLSQISKLGAGETWCVFDKASARLAAGLARDALSPFGAWESGSPPSA